MPYKISGTKNKATRIVIINRDDWSIEHNTIVSGTGPFEFWVNNTSKTVFAEDDQGNLIGYGNKIPEYVANMEEIDATFYINAASDDMSTKEYPTYGPDYVGNTFRSGTEMIIGSYRPGADQEIGECSWRYNNVTIPQWADVVSGTLSIMAVGAQSNTPSLRICGIKEPNAAQIALIGNPASWETLEARTRTTAYVDWVPGAWADGQRYETPDIGPIIQEIVNQVGWESGNSLMMLILDNGSTYTNNYRRCFYYDFALNPLHSAILNVTYWKEV